MTVMVTLTSARSYTYADDDGQLRPTSVWTPMTSHYYQTSQSLHHRPEIIFPSSWRSTPNCRRLMGLSKSTSISRKRTSRVMLKPATNNLLKLAEHELSSKPRRPSGKQWIEPVASSFRQHSVLPTNPDGISYIARRWTRPKTRT